MFPWSHEMACPHCGRSLLLTPTWQVRMLGNTCCEGVSVIPVVYTRARCSFSMAGVSVGTQSSFPNEENSTCFLKSWYPPCLMCESSRQVVQLFLKQRQVILCSNLGHVFSLGIRTVDSHTWCTEDQLKKFVCLTVDKLSDFAAFVWKSNKNSRLLKSRIWGEKFWDRHGLWTSVW
jgi:hypothetical protein